MLEDEGTLSTSLQAWFCVCLLLHLLHFSSPICCITCSAHPQFNLIKAFFFPHSSWHLQSTDEKNEGVPTSPLGHWYTHSHRRPGHSYLHCSFHFRMSSFLFLNTIKVKWRSNIWTILNLIVLISYLPWEFVTWLFWGVSEWVPLSFYFLTLQALFGKFYFLISAVICAYRVMTV